MVALLVPIALASLVAASPPNTQKNACAGPAVSGSSWCKPGPPFAPRAAALVANLTREEKSGLILDLDLGVPRLQIEPYIWWSEALHGAIAPFQHTGAKPGTCWPEPIGIGSSFNESLFTSLGVLTSTEGRGLQGGVGTTYWAPNVNIFRDPRWGRGQETPGEDPTLSSNYAQHFVGGMQGTDPAFLKVSATLKHFAAYSQETGRVNDPVVVTAQDMKDTYLPAFEAGVKLGKASGIMCSYNAETFGYGVYGNVTTPAKIPSQYDGVPSCANKGLLTDLAREKWGFEGYVTTDCGAADYVGGFLHRYGYPHSPADTVHAVLGAGVDTDCGGAGTPNWGNTTLLELMTKETTSPVIEPLIDASLTRLFTVRMRLGQFDPPSSQPWGQYGLERVDTPEHRALAMDAALQGFVLLQNDKAALPLKPSAKIAVLGPNSNSANWQLGNYHERKVPNGVLVSPCNGLKAVVGDEASSTVSCATPRECSVGGNSSVSTCFDDASKHAIDAADVVVLFVGVDGSQEAEGKDKQSLLLPGTQLAMVADVTSAAAAAGDKPVVVVVMGGSAVDLSNIKTNPSVRGILWVGYPGQAGGTAIAHALLGSVNRFGKLPMTWYDEGFCKVADLNDYRMRPDASSGYPGRTHRFYTGTPVFAFGAGLSYTSFERSLEWAAAAGGVGDGQPVVVSIDEDDEADADRVVASLTVRVRNTGERAGDEVVMLYVSPPPFAVALGAPKQQLASFERLTLQAGASATTTLAISQRHLILATAASGGGLSAGWYVRVNDDEGSALEFGVRTTTFVV